jgi:hypothetical protein
VARAPRSTSFLLVSLFVYSFPRCPFYSMSRAISPSMGTALHQSILLPPVISADGTPSHNELDFSELTSASVETKALLSFQSAPCNTTQGLTLSDTVDAQANTRRHAATQLHSLWACKMHHGRQPYLLEVPGVVLAPPAVVARSPCTASPCAADSISSDSIISTHEGSFYASLRMEQRDHHQQQQPRQCDKRKEEKQGGCPTSPTSVITSSSNPTSSSSFPAEIINFSFTSVVATPTHLGNAAGNVWDVPTGQTPSSPFTPFTTAVPHFPLPQPSAAAASHAALQPPCLRSASEQNLSPPAALVQSCTSRSSTAASFDLSNGPRTPQQFLAWRQELVKTRNASMEVYMSKSYSGAGFNSAAAPADTTLGPLSSNVAECDRLRSRSNDGTGVHGIALLHPSTATAHTKLEDYGVVPKSAMPLSAGLCQTRQRILAARHTCFDVPAHPFARSAASPYDRMQRTTSQHLTSSEELRRVSRHPSSVLSSHISTRSSSIVDDVVFSSPLVRRSDE